PHPSETLVMLVFLAVRSGFRYCGRAAALVRLTTFTVVRSWKGEGRVRMRLVLAWMIGVGSMCASAFAANVDLRIIDAARRHDAAGVRSLVKSGSIDVNVRQADGGTALLWAAQWDDVGG